MVIGGNPRKAHGALMWDQIVQFIASNRKEVILLAIGAGLAGIPTLLVWGLTVLREQRREAAAGRLKRFASGHIEIEWSALKWRRDECYVLGLGKIEMDEGIKASARAARYRVALRCCNSSGSGDAEPVYSALQVIPL